VPPGWGDGPPEPARGQPTVPALAPNQRVPARVLAEGEAALALVPEPLALARSLRDTPTGFREYELERDVLSTKLPDVQYTRSAVWLLRWDAELAVEAGDRPRALVALRAQLNASRSVGDEPFLISQLVRMATRLNAARAVERALAHAQFAEADLADLQRAWAEDAEEPFLLNGLLGERAGFYLLFGRLSDGTLTMQEAARERERTFDWYTNWLARGYFPSARAYQLRWFNGAIRVAKRPPHEQLPLPLPERDDSDPAKKVAYMLLPAAHKVAEASVRATADARCTVAALACERFRLKHGKFPDALAELVPALLPEVPKDAFTGEPLGYEKCAGGAIVFSVGQNRTDGAGELDDIGPDFYSGSAVVRFRLYNPDQRKRAAPPPIPVPEPDPNP
jgi:hypothetical protein